MSECYVVNVCAHPPRCKSSTSLSGQLWSGTCQHNLLEPWLQHVVKPEEDAARQYDSLQVDPGVETVEMLLDL